MGESRLGKEVPGSPQKGIREVGYLDTLSRRSKGGIPPSGWKGDSLPCLGNTGGQECI